MKKQRKPILKILEWLNFDNVLRESQLILDDVEKKY